MGKKSRAFTEVPLKIVGGSHYGRYPKISGERTYNMIVSDNFLVPYAGYKNILAINSGGEGRALFSSIPSGDLVAVVSDIVYTISVSLNGEFFISPQGKINTFTGKVTIAENEKNQIAICDGDNIYIYSYGVSGNSFVPCDLDFTPSYVRYQNGYFIAAVSNGASTTTGSPAQWRLNSLTSTASFPDDAQHVGTFQTKPDTVQACIPVPGRENLLMVFGKTATELWSDVGLQLFPYQKSTAYNLDYGCLSSATIAVLDKMICFLGINGQSGPVILFTDGTSDPKPLSDEGVNYKLANLTNPEDSYAFLFKQDGHLIYQLTFPTDNYSFAYDFTSGLALDVCDQNMNYHIARSVAYFNNTYYFLSNMDGNLYEFDSTITNYNYGPPNSANPIIWEIPRIRICPPIRMPDTTRFIASMVTFILEQGNSNVTQRIDMSISKDGAESFSSYTHKTLRPIARRSNMIHWWNLGQANDLTIQLRFWSLDRIVAGDGIVSGYQ